MPEVMKAEVVEAPKTQEVVVETPKVEQEAPKVEAPPEDLVSRVSRVVAKPKEDAPNPFNLTKEDYDKVQNDPVLSKFYKSMQSDYGRKTQELAEQRKQAQAQLEQNTNWSPDRIQKLLNDPNFVNAAQNVLQTQAPSNWNGTQEKWSALNDDEKADWKRMENKVQYLETQNYVTQVKNEDDRLKTRYANYAPDIIDTTIKRLVSKESIATREDIWKVVDYENAVMRAYELGKSDRKVEDIEKSNASSYDGMTMNSPSRVEPPQKGESNSTAFKRILLENISKMKGRNQ